MNKNTTKIFIIAFLSLWSTTGYGQNYLSPTRTVINPVSKEAYVILSTSAALGIVNLEKEELIQTIHPGFVPSDICFSKDGEHIYSTEYTAYGKVHILSSATGQRIRSINVGSYPSAICINEKQSYVFVANRFSNDLSIIDLQKQKEKIRLPMLREPKSLALSPDDKILVVGNFLPSQTSISSSVAACITLVDTEKPEVIRHISLPDGSHSVEDICFSGDGKYVFVTHILSRYQLPTTQLERGWMNTNALSILDISEKKYYTTLLLDDTYRGAANPCGMALSEDNNTLYIAISGTHELITLSLAPLFEKIQSTPLESIANNLNFLNENKVRIPLPGKGAKYPIVQNDKVFVTEYFSGALAVMEMGSPDRRRSIKLGKEPEADEVRKGELYFADAGLCFQNWQSCISCHPGTRADGLNWDLINDGLGNPKNTKSMLYAHVTPPSMITGIRATAEIAVRSGIKHIQFAEKPEEDAVCIDKYLRSLTPLASPFLKKNGQLSKTAEKGKKLFEQSGCLDCHNGSYFTDGKKYNVGTGVDESKDIAFDTPTLKEIWRTAPYLYNGSARTIKKVLTTFNPEDKHGDTSNLSEKEIQALEEYILSL